MGRCFSSASVSHSKAWTDKKRVVKMATGNWFESWDSLVHTIFSWHQHVPGERKYSGSELHSSLNTEPDPLASGHRGWTFLHVWNRRWHTLSVPQWAEKWFSSSQSSFLKFPSWSPSFWDTSVSLQLPFPIFLQLCVISRIYHYPFHVHSLHPFSTTVPLILLHPLSLYLFNHQSF